MLVTFQFLIILTGNRGKATIIVIPKILTDNREKTTMIVIFQFPISLTVIREKQR